MANEVRRRNDNVFGTLSSTLSSTSATMNSAGLANLEAISSTEHAAICIDPGRTAGAPEIIYVTAHTGSATSATIARAKEGTATRAHSSTEDWVHAPTAAIDYLPFRPPSVRVSRDAAQTIGTGGFDTIQFDTEVWDRDTMWSSTNNDQVFVHKAGKYFATAVVGFAASSGGTRRDIGIYKNSTAGSATVDAFRSQILAADLPNTGTFLSVSGMFDMTTSDYLAVNVFQDSGGNLGTSTVQDSQPKFSVMWMSS